MLCSIDSSPNYDKPDAYPSCIYFIEVYNYANRLSTIV